MPQPADLPPEAVGTPSESAPPAELNSIEQTLLENEVVDALRTVYDPEIPVNIYDLGLIYDVSVSAQGDVRVLMTLTSPACPVAESLPIEVEGRIRFVPKVRSARVEVTWDPPFSIDRVPDEVKLMLGLI
jgi:FeS assembly SUF system protein